MSLLRSSLSAFVLAKTAHNIKCSEQSTRSIKRWVAPTLRELRHRVKKMGPQPPEPRSGFIEWNYRAEIFAFGKRLHEEFQLPLLKTAFTQRSYTLQEQHRQQKLGIELADIDIADNRELADRGNHLAKEYIQAYLQYSLPKVPAEGQLAITEHLMNSKTLSHVATHMGMKELIFAAEYPPSEESLATSLLAVIGALEQSSGVDRAFLFVRDFVCTELNQLDLQDVWSIEDPEGLLKKVCKERTLPEPEPRLLGECGKNTVLAAYHVGLYANKELIGKGFGEDIPTAIKTASLDALLMLFEIQDNMRPFDFQLKVVPKNLKLTQN